MEVSGLGGGGVQVSFGNKLLENRPKISSIDILG